MEGYISIYYAHTFSDSREPFTDDKRGQLYTRNRTHSLSPLAVIIRIDFSVLLCLLDSAANHFIKSLSAHFTPAATPSNICCTNTATAILPWIHETLLYLLLYLCLFLAFWPLSPDSGKSTVPLPPSSSPIMSCDYGCRSLPKGSIQSLLWWIHHCSQIVMRAFWVL